MKKLHFLLFPTLLACTIVVSASPGNALDWENAVNMFETNATNLMKAIKNTLRASNFALTLPNNHHSVSQPQEQEAEITVQHEPAGMPENLTKGMHNYIIITARLEGDIQFEASIV